MGSLSASHSLGMVMKVRTATVTPTTSSTVPIRFSSTLFTSRPMRGKISYSVNTPTIAAGTLPAPIHRPSSLFTFLSWWWRAAPNTLVMAA